MWNWKNWIWPGVVTIAAIGVGTIWFETDLVETDLTSRARDVLASGQSFAKVIADGRDLTLEGAAPSEEAQAKALAAVAGLRGVRVVTNKMELLPVEDPFRFSAEKSDAGIKLSGFAPDMLARDALKGGIIAALPGIELNDTLALARGAPENLKDLVAFGTRQLGRMGEGGFDISGETIAFRGSALSSADYEAMVADIEMAGVKVAAFDVAPPQADGPYVFKIEKRAKAAVLSGYVPSFDMRTKLIAAAADGAESKIAVASGAPETLDWELATLTAVDAAGLLANGTVMINGETLSLSGDAKSGAAFKQLQALISQPLPGGLKLGSTDIGLPTIDPFEWRAEVDDTALQLGGYLPSEALREQLLSQAKANFGTLEIRDDLSLANGAPDGFELMAKNALLALSRMESGEITLNGTDVTVSGDVYGVSGQTAVLTFLDSGLPNGFTGQGGGDLKPGPEGDATLQLASEPCQAVLNELGEGNTVLFETGSANIKADSFGFLDRMAYTVRRCVGIGIVVAGHTDSDGNEQQNQKLSEERARAVAFYLMENGVEADRLATVGYGESQPKADNDSDEGKAENRRIEFLVRN